MSNMATVPCHGLTEIVLEAAADHANPLADCELTVVLTAPDGRHLGADGFWDGGRRWCLRLSPDQEGVWTWRTVCAADRGLDARSGTFTAVPATDPFLRRGTLRLSADHRHLETSDGAPFLWLADTAWNGVIRGDDANWERYLTLRAAQGFTVIQFVATHWRGDAVDEFGEASCTETSPAAINPAFFQRIDRRVAMINAHGLIAAPVGLWVLLETDVGRALAEDDALRVLRYVVARYGAYQVFWLFGGDGRYLETDPERWRRLGRGVFRHGWRRLVTLHPCGQSWVGEAYRCEPWFDVVGYQSGHGDQDAHLRWLTEGPPATEWRNVPTKPVINLEPNYEGAYGYGHQTCFDARLVRRAAWWSLLVSPTAGVTYGHDVIWNWNLVAGPSEGHGGWGRGSIAPWHTALETPGIASMTALRRILETLDWWRLAPAPKLLRGQSDPRDPNHHVVAARIADGPALVYTPIKQPIALAEGLPFRRATWIEPATGATRLATLEPTMVPPAEGDWLLRLD